MDREVRANPCKRITQAVFGVSELASAWLPPAHGPAQISASRQISAGPHERGNRLKGGSMSVDYPIFQAGAIADCMPQRF